MTDSTASPRIVFIVKQFTNAAHRQPLAALDRISCSPPGRRRHDRAVSAALGLTESRVDRRVARAPARSTDPARARRGARRDAAQRHGPGRRARRTGFVTRGRTRPTGGRRWSASPPRRRGRGRPGRGAGRLAERCSRRCPTAGPRPCRAGSRPARAVHRRARPGGAMRTLGGWRPSPGASRWRSTAAWCAGPPDGARCLPGPRRSVRRCRQPAPGGLHDRLRRGARSPARHPPVRARPPRRGHHRDLRLVWMLGHAAATTSTRTCSTNGSAAPDGTA